MSQHGTCLRYQEVMGKNSEKLSKSNYKLSDFRKPFDFQENCGCYFVMCRRKWEVALEGNSNPVKSSYAIVCDPAITDK